MNFHIKCPKGWLYNGDVNIEHGGKFYSAADVESGDDLVAYVACWGHESCDNQYTIEAGLICIPAGIADKAIADEFGITVDEVTQLHRVMYADGYADKDLDQITVVQLGKNPDPYATRPAKANVILAHNAKIENYLIRHYLKG